MLAEIIGDYLRKGSQALISGKMITDKYQAQDGSDRYSTKIVVRDMQMLGGKDGSSQGANQQSQQSSQNQRPQKQGGAQQMYGNQQTPTPKPQHPQNTTPDLGGDWSDDIPF